MSSETESGVISPTPEVPTSIFRWPPLESNPEIIEEYMHQLGLPGIWGFSELYGFDEDLLAFVPQPVVAVILNSERLGEKKETTTTTTDVDPSSIVSYYMKQTPILDNACGVIACLHAIFNNMELITLQEGKTLSNYLNKVLDKTPQERALILEESTDFQKQHHTFAAQGQSNLAESQEDVKCHYVAFIINDKNQLVELDGTKVNGPNIIVENCQDVLRGTITEVQRRLEDGQISENLSMMVLCMKEES